MFSSSKPRLIKVMLANAVSCLLFGVLFLIIPDQTAFFLSTESTAPAMILQLLGAILIFNGLHLIWASKQDVLSHLIIWYFSFGDFLWVFFTIGLILTETWITSFEGIISSLLIATLVGIFGILQMTMALGPKPAKH